MWRSGLKQDNRAWKTYSEEEDFAGCVTFSGWINNAYHVRHYTGRFQVSGEDQDDQVLTGEAQSRMITKDDAYMGRSRGGSY